MAGQKTNDVWEAKFRAADKDKNGTLSKAELKELLKAGGSNVCASDLDKLFRFLDGPEGDNKITLKEFITGLDKIKAFIHNLKKEFDNCDADKSGYLDKAELKKILKKSGRDLSEAELDEIMKRADTSKDGKISFEECLKVCT